ncbi:MAG: glycosyl hydrolase family 18 [Pseudobutyrivibrio sp.]|nr:glycosyl hydrolase family 18 [Pseudobutyrivibrio sp.]
MEYERENRRPNTRPTASTNKKRKKKKRKPSTFAYILMAIFAVIVLIVGIYGIKKYSSTNERMALEEYFKPIRENQVAIIFNNEYVEVTEDAACAPAIFENGNVYLEIGWLKDNLDDGYVYDASEITLRYATDKEIYTANLGSADYLIDKSKSTFGYNIVCAQDNTVYVALDYLAMLTDFDSTFYVNPNRIAINTAGFSYNYTTLKGATEIRKLNGPKSPILEDCTKGEKIIVIRDTGKWSFVMSENGVMGYIKNKKLGTTTSVTIDKKLPERQYNHISIGDDISLAWHQSNGQSSIADVLSSIGPIDVISPTWFYLKDNKGGIASSGSNSYVNFCHENGIQVWGLVSNLEEESVDTTVVLNTTSARDALVNNLIAQAITYGLDGINVDIEQLSGNAKDGYAQFIKELSIKCEKNDIILSVDNYVPSGSSAHYNRSMQADYADYVIIMAYDEHYGGSNDPGSVASIEWVEQGVKDTLNEVPAQQVILGIPFYCRVWKTASDGTISSETYGLGSIQKFLKNNEAIPAWSDECGQNYAEFVYKDANYQVWIEDNDSIREKLKVMDNNKLAGAAFWKIGLDNEAVWNVIAEYL